MQRSETTVLQLRGVSKVFGGLNVVEDCHMTVKKGEIRALIGPNGAGKSTIFKLIIGVYSVTAGRILFNGRDITRIPSWRRIRDGISIKMQIPGVYGELSVRDNLRIAAQSHYSTQVLDDVIDELLERLGLKDLQKVQVKTLSHGQQQWLEIGMALASKPALLLLDEPAAGLGPDETEYTAQLVKDLHQSGLTILFIEHDMSFVRRLAQRVTVLHYGKVFAEGTPSEIEENEAVRDIYLGKI